MRIRDMKSALKRRREQRWRLLTRGERAFAWSLAVAPSLLVLGGIALLVWCKGAGRGVGIALLIVALLVVAVPISPFLRARVRRREARAARQR
jgi:hypothetical protein